MSRQPRTRRPGALPAVAALSALSALSAGRPVRAASLGGAHLSVVRSAHALHCPDDAALASRVRSLRPGRGEVTSDLRVEIVIENEDARGLRARMSVHGSRQGEREFASDGPGCEGLAEALAVSLVLLLDESDPALATSAPPVASALPVASSSSVVTPPPSAAPASAPPPSAPSPSAPSPSAPSPSAPPPSALPATAPDAPTARPPRVEPPRGSPWGRWPHPLLGLDLGGGLVLGLPGRLAPAFDVGLRLFPRSPLHVGARFTWTASERTAFAGGVAREKLLRFTADACLRTAEIPRARLDLCALAAAGPVTGSGHGYVPDRSATQLFLALGPGALARGPLTGWLSWTARLSGLVALHRERFLVDQHGVAFDQSPVGGELVVGLEALVL